MSVVLIIDEDGWNLKAIPFPTREMAREWEDTTDHHGTAIGIAEVEGVLIASRDARGNQWVTYETTCATSSHDAWWASLSETDKEAMWRNA